MSHTTSAALPTPANLLANGQSPQHVTLLLPLQGQYGPSAQAIRNGFFAAYYYDKQSNPQAANVRVTDTSQQAINSAYQQAEQAGTHFIVGPLTKPEVQAVAGNNVTVPTLALNSLDSLHRIPNNLYFFSLSPRDEAILVAEKARQDGHRNALVIAPATSWGATTSTAFVEEWQKNGGNVVGSLAFTPKQNLVKAMATLLHVDSTVISSKGFREAQKKKIPLTHLRRDDFDVVFLVASPQQARLIKPLLNFYFAGNIPVYATSAIYSGTPAPQYDRDLNGIIFCDMPWVLESSSQLSGQLAAIKANVIASWPDSYNNYAKLYAMGVDAYYLSQNFSRLISSPQAGFPGATGTLYLNGSHQITRRLVWAQMRDGVPALL